MFYQESEAGHGLCAFTFTFPIQEDPTCNGGENQFNNEGPVKHKIQDPPFMNVRNLKKEKVFI